MTHSAMFSLMALSTPVVSIIVAICCIAVALPLGMYLNTVLYKKKTEKNKATAANIIQEALNEAKTVKKEAVLEAKDEVLRLKNECDAEIKERRAEMQKAENRIVQREDFITKREVMLDSKIESIDNMKAALETKELEIEKAIAEQKKITEQIVAELEKVAGLSKEDAKNQLVSMFEEDAKKDAAILIRNIEQNAKDEADKKAKDIITLAIQKCAADHTSEVTVSSVTLPSDEMKGRIIGREGRNIRALENATGVDLIIDDTPEAVVLSSFDPVRREIARISLEKLILDGRIHPVRIEEVYEKSLKEIENKIKQEGERAAVDLGIMNLNKELSKTLGRLYYRTSYGQNVLKHSIEVGQIAGMLAAELGSDVKTAKRAGLLHDIGKAVDQEQEGTHVQLGADLARRYGEKDVIVHAIEAHHDDVAVNTLTDALVKIADTISAGRPGARRDTLEIYIKRLKKLEEIANSYEGIKQTFAVSAGREVRVIVQPSVFDDVASAKLARDIAKRIEDELEYPGQIRVTVVREARVTEIAK